MKINAPYLDPSLKPEERVTDLIKRMTIEEKTAQLMGVWYGGDKDFKPEELSDPLRMQEVFGKGCHSVHISPLIDVYRDPSWGIFINTSLNC
jgi:hypothetical protein